ITRALADQGRTIRLPVHVADQVRRVYRSRRQLAQKLNRDPSTEEIAAEAGFTPARIEELFELMADPLSLETPIGDGDSVYGDVIEDDRSESQDTATAHKSRLGELAEAVARLGTRTGEACERAAGAVRAAEQRRRAT